MIRMPLQARRTHVGVVKCAECCTVLRASDVCEHFELVNACDGSHAGQVVDASESWQSDCPECLKSAWARQVLDRQISLGI